MLLPTWAIFTIITSPATTPVGLLIVRFVLVVVAVVTVPRCAVAADAGMGMAVFTTAKRTNTRNRASPGIGIVFSVLWVLLETASIDLLILFSPQLPCLRNPI